MTVLKPKTDAGLCAVGYAAPTRCGVSFARAAIGLLLLLGFCMSGICQAEAAEFRDNFADREIIAGTTGVLTGSNTNATRETDEPRHADNLGGRSLWISWIAPTNGIATFRTSGSGFDTLLAAYYFKRINDTTPDELEEAASNDDDDATAPASAIRFGAEAGVRYEIAVDGYRGASGDVRLEWDFTEIDTVAPVIVNAPKDRALRLGDPLTLAVSLQTSPNMRLQWRFNGDSFGAEGPTLFISSLQATNVGRYSLRIRIDDGDDEVRFETPPVEIQINSEGQTNALARDKIFDAVDSPLRPDDDDDDDPVGAGLAPFRAASATFLSAASGVSRGYNGSQIFNTTYATPDPNEPQHCGVAGGASYWFAYEAPTNGTLFLDTIGSGYDTVLAAYEVPPGEFSYQTLISLGCDNDGVAPLGASRVAVPVVAGRQYLVAVDSVGGLRGIAQLNYRLETAPQPDVVPPTLTILSPATVNLVTSNATIFITGTAADNVGVSNILIHTPSATTVATIPATNNWSAMLDLAAGTNVFYFTASDSSGNTSETLGRSIFYRILNPLTLSVQGNGSVSGAADGQILEIGRHYPLIAKPSRGYVFRNWSGATNAATANLRFAMQSNATLTANFIPNPFLPAAGSFNGVFLNDLSLETYGWLKLTLRSSGAFSGSIRQAHRRLSFAGQFDVSGHARARVSRTGTNAIFLNLRLDLPEGNELRGSLDFNSFPVDFIARRAIFHSRTNPATNYTGRYTMLLLGAADGAAAPIGDGYATMTITAEGSLTVAGMLADGTAFSQSVSISRDGDWPLFASLHRGRGLLAGHLRVRPPMDEGSDIEGTAHWLRLAGTRPTTYTNGFLLASPILGSAYTNPVGARLLDLDSATVTLTGESGAELATNIVNFGPGGRMTNGGPHRLTLSVTPRTGLMRGLITLPDSTRSTSLHGIILQRQQIGGGYFQRSNTIGRVVLSP